MAVTPDARHAITASNDETVRVWELHTGQQTHQLDGHTSWVEAVAVTPDGRHAITGSDDHTIRIWDLHTGQQVARLTGDDGTVRCLAVTADDIIVAGTASGAVYFLDLVR